MRAVVGTLAIGGQAMVDRVDLLIAVIGIVLSAVGSSIAFGMAVSRRADKERLLQLETRLDARLTRFETKLDRLSLESVSDGYAHSERPR
jgi:hypothetical protein